MIFENIDYNLGFEPVALRFFGGECENVFSNYHKKTLQEIIQKKKYQKVSNRVEQNYSKHLSQPLGSFLFELKMNNDKFYFEFLNTWGDSKFCQFCIDDSVYLNKKGVYIFTVSRDVKYVGRCQDSFKQRIDQGYGKIYPKNCYIDGQHTNCHINSSILALKESLELLICILNNDDQIKEEETRLKAKYNPPWNLN
jgi:hypothetical protein